MHKISPCLWFDGKAEAATNFYAGIFKNARIGNVMRYGDAGPLPKGSVMSVEFALDGQDFIALNGPPMFAFTPAISLFVRCEGQDEVDDYWAKLSAGGKTLQCGWLTDKFGVTWQIVPTILQALLQDKDAAKSKRVMEAMMKMVKLDIAGLKQAYEQG